MTLPTCASMSILSILVSKEALGPQKCSPVSSNSLKIDFTAEKIKSSMDPRSVLRVGVGKLTMHQPITF